MKFGCTPTGRSSVHWSVTVNSSLYPTPGWSKTEPGAFPTFTTSRPRSTPGYKPVGIQHCTATVISRWEGDNYRFPPYQYQDKFCLRNNQGALRLPNVQEREVIMGVPKVYTQNCVPKGEQGSQAHLDTRLTLIGNSWNVTVVAWLLSQLGARLGLNPVMTVGDIVQRTAPGCSRDLQVSVQATYGQSPWIWSAGPSLGPSEKNNDSGEYERRGHFSASIKR